MDCLQGGGGSEPCASLLVQDPDETERGRRAACVHKYSRRVAYWNTEFSHLNLIHSFHTFV
jgi:hypothetical protein